MSTDAMKPVQAHLYVVILAISSMLAASTIHGCMSAERGGEIAQERAEAESAIQVIQAEIAGLMADLEVIAASDDPDAAATAAQILAKIEGKTEQLQRWLTVWEDASGKLARAESGWDWAEAAMYLAGGLIPGAAGVAAVAIPIIRRSRDAFRGVIKAVADGGGPRFPAATSASMARSPVPKLAEKVADVREDIGDDVDRSAVMDSALDALHGVTKSKAPA